MSDVPPPPSVSPVEVPGISTLLTVVVGVTVVAALYLAQEVLVPITLAILLSFVLAPLADLLRRARLGRVASVLLAVLLALGAILLLGTVIGSQVAGLADEAPRYFAAIQHKVTAVRDLTLGRVSSMLEGAGSPGAAPAPPPPPAAAPATESPFALLERLAAPVVHPLATTGIVLIVTVFILLQREDLRDRLIRVAGSTDLLRTTTALDDAARRLSRYFLAQLTINAAFGCTIATGLYFIGIPSPILWGIIAALLRFVPYIGALLGAALPVALAAAVVPGWNLALLTAGLFLVVDLITGHVVEPLAYGHSTGVSPVSVVVSAVFWSWLWGPVGLILSMPLTLCLAILGRYVKKLEFLDVLLSDRAALSPAESFYQRMLANDPDEALDQAEVLLKERSLTSYYDEVALKGLQSAAADAERGALPLERLERVKRSVVGLINDLAARPDTDPGAEGKAASPEPPKGEPMVSPDRSQPENAAPAVQVGAADGIPEAWRAPGAVLCIAGRGPLDEAGAAMLAQLLEKHGLGARVVVYEAAGRERVSTLDVAGARMACVSYLELSGNPAHLRYLVRRLRARMPDRPILVGLWPAEAPVLTDRALQGEIGATNYAASLRDAVEACVAAAKAERGTVS